MCSVTHLYSDKTELGELTDDRCEHCVERAGHFERLIVVVESCESRPGAEHFTDSRAVLVTQLEVLRAVADDRADLSEETLQAGEALQRHRHVADHVADVIRLKHPLVLNQQLLHRLLQRSHSINSNIRATKSE